MADDKRYNGWTNYETWCVNLWMDNDQGSSRHFAAMAQDAYDDARAADAGVSWTKDEAAAFTLRDALKEHFEQEWEDITEAAGKHIHISSSMWADLMGAALSEVNWQEIAEHLIEDVDKEEIDASDPSPEEIEAAGE